MAMDVTIGVIGSSMVYFDGTFWHIVFITDSCHDVRWASPATGMQYRPFAKSTYPRTVTFRGDVSTPVAGWSNAEKAKFFNLSDSNLHGQVNNSESNLLVMPESKNGRQWVHLKIPFGTVKASGPMSRPYYYKQVGNYYRVPLGRGVASSYYITFTVRDGEKLYLDIDDVTGPAPIEIPHTPGRVMISFNNYCGTPKGYNDFIHYYDWVYDRTSVSPHNPKQFIAGEDDDPLRIKRGTSPRGLAALEEKMHAAEKAKATYMYPGKGTVKSIDGDCDPVIIDPPPGD